MHHRLYLVSTLCLVSGCSAANDHIRPRIEQQILADPGFLEQYAATRRFSAGQPGSIKILPDGSAVLFLRSGPRSFVQDLYEFDAASGKERLLLTAESILNGAEEKLTPEERARRERMRQSARGIASYHISKDGSKVLVPLSGRLFVITRTTGEVRELVSDKGFPIDPRFSPDGRYVSCVRDNELFVMEIGSSSERQLTSGSNENLSHGVAEFAAQEEMDRREGYWWSPDSRLLAYQETDTSGMERMFIADAMHTEKPPQSWPYPRAGKKNAAVRVGLIPVEGGETRWTEWDREKYPYLATVKWTENAPLTILVQNRRQTEEVLYNVDSVTARVAPLLTEKDDIWLNLDAGLPKWLPDGKSFMWTTERNGSWQLELRARDGGLIRAVTSPDFRFKSLADVDPVSRVAYVTGGDDPTQTQLFKVSLDAENASPVPLTTEPGVHGAIFSENKKIYMHTGSLWSGTRFQIVREAATGRELGRLTSAAETPPFMPNAELAVTGGNPGMHAVLIRPRDFDRTRRYPAIVSVYGGPHAQTVQASRSGYLLQQWIADQGFIVVSIDGRGTPSRGRGWERAIRGDFIDVALSDQVAGLQALGREYPELDLNRVGIYGWSFGGYFSAMAVMKRPDVFSAGVAGAPVAEWLDYDTHYTERYLGLPEENSDAYMRSSVLTYAKDLKNPLLVIHGTADDNVYFMHSLKLSNELFRAGKHHEFLALSDFTHMVADPLVTTRLYQRIVGFFAVQLR